MMQIKKRQLQRLLHKKAGELGISRTEGGHWVIPNSARVRNWAKNHRRWKRDSDKSLVRSINPKSASARIISIEAVSQEFELWLQRLSHEIPDWNEAQIIKAMDLLSLPAGTYDVLAELLETKRKKRGS